MFRNESPSVARLLHSAWKRLAVETIIAVRIPTLNPDSWSWAAAGDSISQRCEYVRSALKNSRILQTLNEYHIKPQANLSIGVKTIESADGNILGAWFTWPAILPQRLEDETAFIRTLSRYFEVETRWEKFATSANAGIGGRNTEEMVLSTRLDEIEPVLRSAQTLLQADLTYWAKAYPGEIRCRWHTGTISSGFGFELPVGKGVGGRAFIQNSPFGVIDYQQCGYRYGPVEETIDHEKVRSVLAFPIIQKANGTRHVLYVARRNVQPFSHVDQILLRRLLQPMADAPLPAKQPFAFNNASHFKNELRELLNQSNGIAEFESWIEKWIQGPAIVTDEKMRPYLAADFERLTDLRATPFAMKEAHIIKVKVYDQPSAALLCMWPSIDLPPHRWNDFLEDIITACNVILERSQRAHSSLAHQRSGFMDRLLRLPHHPTAAQVEDSIREASRLGLTVDHGELWCIIGREPLIVRSRLTDQGRVIEEIALERLHAPIVVQDTCAFLVLHEHSKISPSEFRDEILAQTSGNPIWIIHGAVYDSFETFVIDIHKLLDLAQSIISTPNSQPVLAFSQDDLSALLESPEISQALFKYAKDRFEPLLRYDTQHNTQLTKTLVEYLTSDSFTETAQILYVHPNTARHRVQQALKILDRELSNPKTRTVLSLAAFVWQYNFYE